MKILFVTSEVYPLIKTGGLADVSYSLPKALKKLHQDIRLVLPAYASVLERLKTIETIATVEVTAYSKPVHILRSKLEGMPIYLIEATDYFQRPGHPYIHPQGHDWPDNAQRFATFCRAVIKLGQDPLNLNWQPDIVHCNDWQTGLIPALLSQQAQRPATLFTIHNLAYQGLFPYHQFYELQLPNELWSMHGLEFYGQMSFIKGGLYFADHMTTVSPSYAREIKTNEFAYGLEGLLKTRSPQLTGILNGIDTQVWNPKTDSYINKNYDEKRLHKKTNKQQLQQKMQLPVEPNTLLFAYIGRLVAQKGVDLILNSLEQLMAYPIQFVILGSGEAELEQQLTQAQQSYPQQMAIHLAYDEALSHQIEASADVFLMPSRYEPCGLNQLYSLRYGTIPIVRRTGGLMDTVVEATTRNIIQHKATGFLFDEANVMDFTHACLQAIDYYYHKPKIWRQLIRTAMQEDFSWQISAKEYLQLYQSIKK